MAKKAMTLILVMLVAATAVVSITACAEEKITPTLLTVMFTQPSEKVLENTDINGEAFKENLIVYAEYDNGWAKRLKANEYMVTGRLQVGISELTVSYEKSGVTVRDTFEVKVDEGREDISWNENFVPDGDGVWFLVGQDLDAVGGLDEIKEGEAVEPEVAHYGYSGYVDYFGMPSGVTTYTQMDLNGLWTETDWGAGPTCAYYYITDPDFSDTIISIGFAFSSSEHGGSTAEINELFDEIVAGEHDDTFDSLAEFFALGKENNNVFFLRLGYEFAYSGNYYSPEGYKKAFRYVTEYLRDAGADNFVTVFQSQDDQAQDVIDAYYPGDEYVDWFGVSAFGSVGSVNMYETAEAKGKPVIICEWTKNKTNVNTSPEKVKEHIINFLDPDNGVLARYPVIKAIAYINQDWDSQPMWDNEAGGYWNGTNGRLQENPEVRQWWGEILTNPKYRLVNKYVDLSDEEYVVPPDTYMPSYGQTLGADNAELNSVALGEDGTVTLTDAEDYVAWHHLPKFSGAKILARTDSVAEITVDINGNKSTHTVKYAGGKYNVISVNEGVTVSAGGYIKLSAKSGSIEVPGVVLQFPFDRRSAEFEEGTVTEEKIYTDTPQGTDGYPSFRFIRDGSDTFTLKNAADTLVIVGASAEKATYEIAFSDKTVTGSAYHVDWNAFKPTYIYLGEIVSAGTEITLTVKEGVNVHGIYGTYMGTFSQNGGFVTFDAKFEQQEKIYLNTDLHTVKGLTVTLVKDGQSTVIDNDELTFGAPVPTGEAGKYTVSVSYLEYSTDIEITITPKAPEYITVIYDQGDNVYYAGMSVDRITGVSVEVTNNDGTTETLKTGFTLSLSGGGQLTEGQCTVTVTYEGFTDTFKVNVLGEPAEKVLAGITAVLNEGATVKNNMTLDEIKALLTVTAVYSDDSTETLNADDYTLEGTIAAGERTFTVKYANKTKQLNVNVEAYSEIIWEGATKDPNEPDYTGYTYFGTYQSASKSFEVTAEKAINGLKFFGTFDSNIKWRVAVGDNVYETDTQIHTSWNVFTEFSLDLPETVTAGTKITLTITYGEGGKSDNYGMNLFRLYGEYKDKT